jgi:hypothetical protein
VEHLRQEILNSQQVRSDLLKWKLALVGALGAAGLGLAGADVPGHAELVLCAVPFVSVYVDLLCRHLNLRILVIGTYLASSETAGRSERKELMEYERFVEERARHLRLPPLGLPAGWRTPGGPGRRERRHGYEGDATAFDLEDWAVSWSSLLLSLAVLIYGLFVLASSVAPAVALIASGTIGIAVTALARADYGRRQDALRRLRDAPTGS